MSQEPGTVEDIAGARCLVRIGDSVTTDHISPAGSIKPESPAGRYLVEHGVERKDFNSYGSRRGNHEVMVRGTFANVRLRNLLVPGSEGTWTVHLPSGEETTIFEASERYLAEGVPLIVIAGKEYGSGSSRDWAAKGPNLLGVRAVIAESYERIHRSNLLMMGILPLQFRDGETPESLGLTGRESFSIEGIENGEAREVTVRADGTTFTARVRPRHARASASTSATAGSSRTSCGGCSRLGLRASRSAPSSPGLVPPLLGSPSLGSAVRGLAVIGNLTRDVVDGGAPRVGGAAVPRGPRPAAARRPEPRASRAAPRPTAARCCRRSSRSACRSSGARPASTAAFTLRYDGEQRTLELDASPGEPWTRPRARPPSAAPSGCRSAR